MIRPFVIHNEPSKLLNLSKGDKAMTSATRDTKVPKKFDIKHDSTINYRGQTQYTSDMSIAVEFTMYEHSSIIGKVSIRKPSPKDIREAAAPSPGILLPFPRSSSHQNKPQGECAIL